MKEKIRYIRNILQKTQKQIADILGLSQSFWADLERGYSKTTKQTFLLLEKAFGVNPDWFTGKSHILFADWEKGLEIVKGKSILTRWELLFLCEVMSWVWSQPLKIEKTTAEEEAFIANLKNVIKETRKDFIINLCYAVKYVLKKIQNLQFRTSWLENLLQVYGHIISKIDSIQNEPPSLYIARELAKTLHSFLCEVELDSRDEFKLSSLLLPWGYYVALAHVAMKQGLIPLSSVHFEYDAFIWDQEDFQIISKKFEIQKGNVSIKYEPSFLHIDFNKVKISLNPEEAFGFFTMILEAPKTENEEFSVLNYNIVYNNIVIDKKTIISIDEDDQENLIRIIQEIATEKPDFWLFLQKAFVKKYGFV
jgi:transcriptional regulator with XRE-family HTH domain